MLAADCGMSSQRDAPTWNYYQAYQGDHGSISFSSLSSLFPFLNCISDQVFFFWCRWIPGVTLSCTWSSDQFRLRGDPSSPPPRFPRRTSATCALVEGGTERLWDDGDPGIGCKLELGVWASGAALLRGPEPAQSVQPATDPRAEETLQHRGQAMGPSPQQTAQTKGLRLTHAHTSHTYTSCVFSLLSALPRICSLLFITVSLPSVCSACLSCSLSMCAFAPRVSFFHCRVDYCSYLMALLTAVDTVIAKLTCSYSK